MVSLERKFDVLHHSISSFTRWLDGCNSLLEDMESTRDSLEGHEEEVKKKKMEEGGSEGDPQSRGDGRGKDGGVTKFLEGGGKDECVGGEGVKTDKEEKELRGLALKYKDMLLQMKEQCGYMQQINSLCKEIKTETKDDHQMQRHAKAYETVNQLSRRFAVTCATAKKQYSHLSSLLQATSGAKFSPTVIKIPTPSFSPTPTLTHRITTTTPSPSHTPRPNSAQANHSTITTVSEYYHPVFVRPTTFSLYDREREEEGWDTTGKTGDGNGLKSESEKSGNVDDKKQKVTKSVENGARSRPMSWMDFPKKRESVALEEDAPIPEILTLEGSPVIPGRRLLRAPSQESLEKRGGSSPDMGRTVDRRGSPVLLPFQNGSPDLRIDHPRTYKRPVWEVKVLPTNEMEQKGKSQPPPTVKPKPMIAKKPQFLKRKTDKEEKQQQQQQQQQESKEQSSLKEPAGNDEGTKSKPKKSPRFPKIPGFGGGNGGRSDSPKLFGRSRKDSDKPNEKGKGGRDSPVVGKKKPKAGKKGSKEDGRSSPKLFSGDREEIEWEGEVEVVSGKGVKGERESPVVGKKKNRAGKKGSKEDGSPRLFSGDRDEIEWEGEVEVVSGKGVKGGRESPVIGKKKNRAGKKGSKEDGSPRLFSGDRDEIEWEGEVEKDRRESPILRGKGVKVSGSVLSRVAEPAKQKATPPPVARKPVGLMERILAGKKTDELATTRLHPKQGRGDSNTSRHSGADTTHGSEQETIGNREPDASTKEVAAAPSQNIAPKLRVQVYKLENLADTSFARASNSNSASSSNSSGWAAALPTRGLLPSEAKLPNEQRSVKEELFSHEPHHHLSSLSREEAVKLSSSSLQSGEDPQNRQRSRETVAAASTEVGARPERLQLEARDLEAVVVGSEEFRDGESSSSSHQDKETSTDMDIRPGYDRLVIGRKVRGREDITVSPKRRGAIERQRGSGKYDKLSEKKGRAGRMRAPIYGAMSDLEESVESLSGSDKEVNGGWDWRKGADEGGKYFVGGRGRENEMEGSGSAETKGREGRDEGDSAGSQPGLKERLEALSTQLQRHIQAITDREKSNLQSLPLYIHMGEVKAMLALLEVQDFELAHLRANFSPSAQQKLASLPHPPASHWKNFTPEEIRKSREEILKLSERIELLEKHCRDSISQIEEVMEFVILFEEDLKSLTDFLSTSKERLQLSRQMGEEHSEEAWKMLTDTLADVNGQRTKLSAVETLASHLLYLEPIFDGDSVREDMHHLSTEYQGIILEIFSQLEALAHVKCENLLLEMSVLTSWATEAGLAVQALAKRSKQSSGVGDRIAASKESLENEIQHHKASLLSVTKQLEKITSLLSPDDHGSLRELVFHVSQASKSLVQIENALGALEFGKAPKVKGNGAKSSDPDYVEMSDLEDSLRLLTRKNSRVVPPVPVRNMNGAKAKESDYARIEDLNVHGHTPQMQRKTNRLVPYAEVSMKDSAREVTSRYVELDMSAQPPPVPKRPAQPVADKDKRSKPHYVEISELKVGQSIQNTPLPPRPTEGGPKRDFERSPPPLPPPPDVAYNSHPKPKGSRGQVDGNPRQSLEDSGSLYDVPRSLLRGESYDLYDVPKSVVQQQQRQSDGGGVVSSQGDSHDIYDVPRSLGRGVSLDLYDVPKSLQDSSLDLYDVPRSAAREGQEDVYNVPRRAGQSDSGHATSSQDEATSPPLYDVPKSLRQRHSRQEESGQTDSGQEDGEAYRTEMSPELTYDVPRSLLEPLSPLMEFNQFTHQLDSAIRHLPRSSPYRPDIESLGEGLNGKEAEFRPVALHKELLQFIIKEWSQLPSEVSPPPSVPSRAVVEETARLLDNHAHSEACLTFAQQVGELEENLKGVVDRISHLRVPKEPDLEKVHNGIDQCESLFTHLKKLQAPLDSCNERSLSIFATISPTSSPPLPTALPHPPPSVRLTQLIEIWLFDLTTIFQNANVQLATKLRELRESESRTNTLHRQLQTLSHTLSAAGQVLGEREEVTEVRGYLHLCKEMHKKLSAQSVWIDQLVTEIQDYVASNPQSQACQELLEQIQQIETEWTKTCQELSATPQLEPTLIVYMLRNISTSINAMENELPGLEVKSLKLEDIIDKQKKARSLVSKVRHLLSSLQTAEVNLQQTLSPPAGNHGDRTTQEVVGGVDHAHQQRQCRELQQECRKILSELKTLGSLLATSHTLLDRLANETRDMQLWIDDTKAIMELGEKSGSLQHTVKFQAISQQVIARQRHMESYQSLVTEVLLLPGDEGEKKEIEKEVLALYTDWDTICQQCIPAGTLPLMSPTTPQSKCFQAPQEFEDPLQMVEWLILLESKLQPEMLVVGDYLHVRRALRDVQLIEAELQCKVREYERFVKDLEAEQRTRPDIESESQFDESEPQREGSESPEPLAAPVVDSLDFNSPQGVKFNDENTTENRRRRREVRSAVISMESVQEQSGEEDDGNGIETPHIGEEVEGDSNKSTPRNSLHSDGATATETKRYSGGFEGKRHSGSFDWTHRRQLSAEHASHPRQQSMPLPVPQSSLLSSLNSSSADYSSRSLLSRQVSLTSSITTSLAEFLVAGSPTGSIPDDLYQLMTLWNGIKMAIGQKRQRLEQIRDLWKSFEAKKEEFVKFLTIAENRLQGFSETLGQATDMGVIQSEFETQKVFLEEIPVYEQKHAVLNELGHNLATRYHSEDSTTDLQDVLKDIDQRWDSVMDNVSRHQPEVNLLSRQWAEFHTHYQSFHQWLRNMDTEMANLNPFISNMATIQIQLEKLKEIQEELKAHEGVMDSLKLLSYKLQQQEEGRCHVNQTAIHARLENASRRWDHLLKLALERRSALEESLTDKQQLLTRMADCLSWLQQAEKHLASQKPLGGDYYQIHDQYLAHQTFSQEVHEQEPKMETVVQAGRSGLLEVQWPLRTPERSRMDSLRSEFAAVERRWGKVKGEGEEWGKMLELLHPEMEAFQMLCAECGQRLSEVELRASAMPPIANRVVMLTQQLEELREFESGLIVMSDVLERVIASQTKLVQLGADVSTDLSDLVKRFHQRWSEVKKRVTTRYSSIDKAMVKYDPENMGVATLPRGWIREKTKNGTPYYVENTVAGQPQWQHPELSQLYNSLELKHNQPCYPSMAYPAALKLRALQKKTQLHLLETRIAMQTFEEDHIYNIYNSNKSLSSSDMIMLSLGLFEQAERHPAVRTEPLYVNRAVELTASWIRDVYDITHEGSMTCVSFQIALVCLSHGRLEDKQRSLFRLIARDNESITLHQLADFLEHLIQIPQSMLETQYCSLDTLDYYAQECFKKFSDESGRLSLSQFLVWVQTEPLPLAWLAVLHRVMASECTQHDVKCAVCRGGPPIQGFRYRCLQCHNYDMCQSCFWSGGTTHGHDRTKHYMEEYCVVRSSGDELKDFFRNLQRHMKRKKKTVPAAEVLQEHAPHVIGDPAQSNHSPGKAEDLAVMRSPHAKQRHSTFTSINVGDGDSQPYRRYSSPPSQAYTTISRPEDVSLPPSHPPKPARKRGRGQAVAAPQDVDYSLNKISRDNKNISQTLNTLRRHRDSLSSNPEPPSLRMQNGEAPVVSAANEPDPDKAAFLQGRVRVLEEHNSKLQGYISQLKTVTETPQPLIPKSDYPVGKRPAEGGTPYNNAQSTQQGGPVHQKPSNGSAGSPAHRPHHGAPLVQRERKYHYIAAATGSPTHKKTSPSPSHHATNHHQAVMATGSSTHQRTSPAHSHYVQMSSPAHQRMVLQPPALVRNKSHSPATLL